MSQHAQDGLAIYESEQRAQEPLDALWLWQASRTVTKPAQDIYCSVR
eukprot:SAG11_NODE_3010_length_2766_cov_13.698163_3_plen_47_part_00